MGFLDFLKKKPVVATQPAVSSSQTVPNTPINSQSSQLDLPELPSFDANMHSDMSHDLPPLPSFEDANATSAPASFSLPEMPTFESAGKPTLKEPASMAPPSFLEQSTQSQSDYSQEMPSVDARTPYGPVFCDVETYREILTNMAHAKEEVVQLQSFAENGHKLQQKAQTQYDSFHSTLSSMAKKLLLAEAKLFK